MTDSGLTSPASTTTTEPETTPAAASESSPHNPAEYAAPIDRAAAQRAKNAEHPERGPILPTKVPWRAVTVFIVIALGGAWLVQLPVWLSGEGLESPLFGILTLAMMFTPTLAALVVVFFVKRPANIPRLLGLSPLRPWKRTWGFMLLAAVTFTVLPLLAMLVGSAFGWIRLDFVNFSGFAEAIDTLGTDTGGMSIGTIVALQLLLLPLTGIQSSAAAFGEELGWRGWLLPNLRPLGTVPALVITGIIWGIWHAPIILLGYNYQRTDVIGILLMVVWCVLLGIVIGWMRLRSASVWPAVIAHGTLNAATNTYFVFIAAGQDPADLLWGTILGWAGWIVLAVAIVVLIATGQLRKQAVAGLTLDESRG